MAAGRHSALVVALGLVATLAVANDAVDSAAGAGSAAAGAGTVAGAAPQVAPRVSERLGARVEAKLDRAFALAVHQLDSLPACRELYARLGKDGLTQLSTTLYYPASVDQERVACHGALAVTHVGGPATRLCSRFDAIGDREAAMVVLHEALHWSGLTERPQDHDAMSSTEINQMVRTACGL